MSPKNKIPTNSLGSKENCVCPTCSYCGFPRCWKHGKYGRKWFHQLGAELSQEPVAVQRYLCQHPSCERTFSVLPENVLPYCRFFMSDLLSIVQDRTEGKSSYWIAKYRRGLSLRVILRTVSLIRKVTPLLECICREVTGSVGSGFQALVKTILVKFSWSDFTRRWFHGLYPCRAGNIFNPHNLGIKRL
jgi:hypothetical protein